MAVDCTLVDEDGVELARVGDPGGALNNLIPDYEDARFQCWRFIDEYGDTVFNRAQMQQFLTELELVRNTVTTPGERALLEGIESLAVRCRDDVHLYLKFVGD